MSPTDIFFPWQQRASRREPVANIFKVELCTRLRTLSTILLLKPKTALTSRPGSSLTYIPGAALSFAGCQSSKVNFCVLPVRPLEIFSHFAFPRSCLAHRGERGRPWTMAAATATTSIHLSIDPAMKVAVANEHMHQLPTSVPAVHHSSEKGNHVQVKKSTCIWILILWWCVPRPWSHVTEGPPSFSIVYTDATGEFRWFCQAAKAKTNGRGVFSPIVVLFFYINK